MSGVVCGPMSIHSLEELRIALSHDLNKSGVKPEMAVVNNEGHKSFTTSRDGAVFEFPHKQADVNFWNGEKYYARGNHNKIRIRRTPSETAPVKAPVSRKKPAVV